METKIAKLSQDNQCQVQNAEAVKKGLEAKLKEQEKELREKLQKLRVLSIHFQKRLTRPRSNYHRKKLQHFKMKINLKRL